MLLLLVNLRPTYSAEEVANDHHDYLRQLQADGGGSRSPPSGRWHAANLAPLRSRDRRGLLPTAARVPAYRDTRMRLPAVRASGSGGVVGSRTGPGLFPSRVAQTQIKAADTMAITMVAVPQNGPFGHA